MQLLRKIRFLLVPYRNWIAGHIAASILMAVFSVISIPAIIPFLQLLFGEVPRVESPPENWRNIGDIATMAYYHMGRWIEAMGQSNALLVVCGVLIGIFLLKNAFRYLALFCMAPIRTGIVRDLRKKLVHSWLSNHIQYFTSGKKGDMLSRITTDIHEVEWSILSALEAMVKEPLLIIGALAMMWLISPSLTLIVFALIIVMGTIIGMIGNKLRRQSGNVQHWVGKITSKAEELISGQKVIRAFNAGPYIAKGFDLTNEKHRYYFQRLLWRKDLASPLSEFLGVMVAGIILWTGGRYVFDGALQPASFIAFVYAFYSVITPAKAFATAYFNIRKGNAALDRLYESFDHEKETNGALTVTTNGQPVFSRTLQFKQVSYRYPGKNEDAVHNISFTVPRGSNTALVGASGAGKSTVLDLMLRFYAPHSGQILIDDQPVDLYSISDTRSLFGIVTQDPFLFHDTVAENIAFGKQGITRDDIIRAAQAAHAHEFIMQLPQQYQTVVGDRGLRLSGGQRQRLTIARAALLDPAILLLDEATSALDAESEMMVQLALKTVMENRTTITIAHRLSTIIHADQIIVIDRGRIVETGKHRDLIEQSETYRNIMQL